jgi:hypothetical protein
MARAVGNAGNARAVTRQPRGRHGQARLRVGPRARAAHSGAAFVANRRGRLHADFAIAAAEGADTLRALVEAGAGALERCRRMCLVYVPASPRRSGQPSVTQRLVFDCVAFVRGVHIPPALLHPTIPARAGRFARRDLVVRWDVRGAAAEATATRRGCRMSPSGARSFEKPTQMSRSKALREGSETNKSPRNGPCSHAADICDSLRHKEQRWRSVIQTRMPTGTLSQLLTRRGRSHLCPTDRLRPSRTTPPTPHPRARNRALPDRSWQLQQRAC